MKHTNSFAAVLLALATGIAHANCEPTEAAGAIIYQEHPSGAVLIAYRCADGTSVAFAARPDWEPKIPPWPREVARLRVMSGYDGKPNPLNADALKLLNPPSATAPRKDTQ